MIKCLGREKKMETDRIKIRWSKRDNDLLVSYDDKRNGHFVSNLVLTDELLSQLEARGYDIKTLKFEIKKK